MTLGFSRMLLNAILSGPDFGISQHAVNQHSDWLVAETVKHHIKFSQLKIPSAMRPLIKIL